MILLLKGHVKGYTRSDGVFVSPHFRHADEFAAAKHAGQMRKDGKTPYIEHPRAVARILHDEAGVRDMPSLQAALLHDTIEDSGATHAELEQLFGPDVASLVVELTNEMRAPGVSKRDAQVAKAKNLSARAAAVKTADKIANLRDILSAPPTDWDATQKRRYYDDARDMVSALAQPHPILSRLFSSTYLSGVDHF